MVLERRPDGPDRALTGTALEVTAMGGSTARVLRIDCADCDHQDSPVCGDCLVTFLCEREDDGAVVVPLEEIRAVRLLQDRGLAPRNLHRSTGTARRRASG